MSDEKSSPPHWDEESDADVNKSTVLVVDDSEFFANMMAREIDNRSSFETISRYSGEQALDELADHDIDCIVSDYQMEPITGLELLERVREEYESTPFILLTGQGGEEVAIEAIRLGASDYVTKGTVVESGEFSLLLNRIETSVAHSKAQRELSRRKAQLEKQRDNLDILNEVLRHDIRNDLQIITAYSDHLPEYLADGGQEYLQTIQNSAENAIELTMTAERIATVMTDKGIERQEMDIRPVIREEVEAIDSTNPNVVIEIDRELPRSNVLADTMVGAVIRNLLKNAIQHNDKDVPEIVVSNEQTEGCLEVRIADNGPGISDDRKEEIFGKGEQGLKSEGTGIGLHLVHTLAERYKGAVWVEDNEPEGSIFVVEMPLAK